MTELLKAKLAEATRQVSEALEAEAEAQVKFLYDKEELRAAEGNCTLERIRAGTLGKNEIERRAQLDSDCSNERNRMIEAEADVIRQTARRKQWEAKYGAAMMFIHMMFIRGASTAISQATDLVNQTKESHHDE